MRALRKTRVLVSGENLRTGGGRRLLEGLLVELSRRSSLDVCAMIPSTLSRDVVLSIGPRMRLLERDRWSPLVSIRESRSNDVLLSLGNWAVPMVSVPQVVLCHWPYVLYEAEDVWGRMPVRDRLRRMAKVFLFHQLIGRADVVLLQTDIAEARFRARHPDSRTRILPNSVPVDVMKGARSNAEPRRRPSSNVLVLSRYYPHKNFAVLLDVADHIRASGRKLRILTTLDPAEDPSADAFLRTVAERGLASVIVNLGPLSRRQVSVHLGRASILLLPSLLESFSRAYLEAMAARVPIVTSDRDFARAVCGTGALYVNPHDSEAIFRALITLEDQKCVRDQLVGRGTARLAEMPDTGSVVDELEAILLSLAMDGGSP